jgi:hypothetical protein
MDDSCRGNDDAPLIRISLNVLVILRKYLPSSVASCTFPFTLAREVAMSRVVVDGGEQHGTHFELLTLLLIPNLRHTRLP